MARFDRSDLIILASLAARPLRVDEAAAALGVDADEVLLAGSELTNAGELVEEAGGYRAREAVDSTSARAAHLAARLAEVLEARNGGPGELGRLLHIAGRDDRALPMLVRAALDADDEHAALLALDIADGQHLEQNDIGLLHLVVARRQRGRGESTAAYEHATAAMHFLDCLQLIDAMGFAGAIADDLQRPQQSEAFSALGAMVAFKESLPAKAGSLLTLQGRSLARIGYSDEADRVLEQGLTLLSEHGDREQKLRGRMNQAWVLLDREEVRAAEVLFSDLAEHAERIGDRVGIADKRAYRSRALFGMGRLHDAAGDAELALVTARPEEAFAPELIVHLGEAEGYLQFGRAAEALAAATRAVESATEHLPAWRNRALHYRAKAEILVGDRELARQLLSEASTLTPEGVNGWRVRTMIGITELELLDASVQWPQREAEDLTDELLQARRYGAAAELLTIRARREKDAELGLQAAALAVQIGKPMAAAFAIEEARAWSDPAAIDVARMVRGIADQIPDEWRSEWESLPAVQHALEVDTTVEAEAGTLAGLLDDVLTASGLSGAEVVLSPAQRRAGGLVRHKARRRRAPWQSWMAAALGVVAIAVAGTAIWIGVNQEEPEPSTVTVFQTTLPTTTTTLVPVPEAGISGTFAYRGNAGLSGVVDRSGIQNEPTGTYWWTRPGRFGSALSEPIAAGKWLYFGSNTDEVYELNLETGRLERSWSAVGRVREPVAVGELSGNRLASAERMIVFASDAERVFGESLTGAASLQYRPGAAVVAPPIIAEGLVIVVSENGVVAAFDASGEEPIWTYPKEGTAGTMSHAAAFAEAEGLLYVVTDDQELHIIEAGNGDARCAGPLGLAAEPVSHPVVDGGLVYLILDGQLATIPVDSCDFMDFRTLQWNADQDLAVADGIVYTVEGLGVSAIEPGSVTGEAMQTGGFIGEWGDDAFGPDARITTAPVLAGERLYVGTEDGMVYALDIASGAKVWEFDVSAAVGEPVVVSGGIVVLDRTIIVTTTNGAIVAIAGE